MKEELLRRLSRLHWFRVNYGDVINSGVYRKLNLLFALLNIDGLNDRGMNYADGLITNTEIRFNKKLQEKDGKSHANNGQADHIRAL